MRNENCELWILSKDAFFLYKRVCQCGVSQWECIVCDKSTDESYLSAAKRELHRLYGRKVAKNRIKLLGYERVGAIDTYVCMVLFDARIGIRDGYYEKAGAWRSVQEIESLHFDESFSTIQFNHYIRFIRENMWKFYFDSKAESIQRVIEQKYELIKPKRGLPPLGIGQEIGVDDTENTICKAFEVYGDDLSTIKTEFPESVNNSLGTGNPLDIEMFPLIRKKLTESLLSHDYYKYPMPAGDISARRIICEYLYSEGFSKKITPENIIFTASTTHGFNLILKMIIRPGDVVLFTAPTYGLFALAPKRFGGQARFIELRKENGWLVNPQELNRIIQDINKELIEHNEGAYSYNPKVVAYVNINPHNPIGKVMGHRQSGLVEQIARVCRKNGVFVIDDLIYRDICFDRSNLSLPISSFESEVQNCITLMGLSKAFGVAGFRTGFLVADETIIRGIRSYIFQENDSISELNTKAITAAYNSTKERYVKYNEYFNGVMDEYRFRYNLVRAAVDGIGSVEEKYKRAVISEVEDVLGTERGERWLSGIKAIRFIEGTEPEAGFFCLIDFTNLKNLKYGEWNILDETSLLKYMFHRYRINFITGGSIGWPDKEALIARVSFSVPPEKLITVFELMSEEISRLEI